jgi:uncharacterized membrane protein YfcA
MIPPDYFLVVAFGFLLGMVDASFGMGYGTLLTPMLLAVGLDPLQVIPAVLGSQLAGDFLAALFHHRFKNVDFSWGSRQLKVAGMLAILSVAGAVIAVLIAVNLPTLHLTLYIGTSVAVSGLVILAVRKRSYGFSWSRLLCLGSFAAFNKGISGGGYGPIVVAGQILSGIEVKGAIGITALAEGVTCIVALFSYLLVGESVDWLLLILLSIGITFSTPLAAFVVKKVESRRMKLMIGIFTLVLGLATILQALQKI